MYLIQELNIAVVHQLRDHGDVGPVHGPFSLQHNGGAQRRQRVPAVVAWERSMK